MTSTSSLERHVVALAIVAAVTLGTLTSVHAKGERTYFDQGTWDVGFGLGFNYADDGGAMDIGVEVGYFVLDGLAPGVWILGHIGFGDEPSAAIVDATLTYYFIRSGFLLPHISGVVGKAFYEDDASAWNFGAGAGVTLALMEHFGLSIKFLLLRFDFPGTHLDTTSTMGSFSLVYIP